MLNDPLFPQNKISHRHYHWYALHTNSRAEKKVFAELTENNIEAYLPLLKRLKQWSDRKKWVEEPLIRSYVFVRVSKKEYLKALQTRLAVRYICFNGKAAIIPDDQIRSLKILLASDEELEVSTQNYAPGDLVKVVTGPLAHLTGELVETMGTKKVRVRIEHIGYSILVTIPNNYLSIIDIHKTAIPDQDKDQGNPENLP
ncbi:MAG: UpxY family transcription antiterminator [Bacteroidia bacterium]|nr:UpxY family transcription antiterminator [Bacteroidia bacterium]